MSKRIPRVKIRNTRGPLPPGAKPFPVAYIKLFFPKGRPQFAWIHDCKYCRRLWDEEQMAHGPFKTLRAAENDAVSFMLKSNDGWHDEPLH